MNMVTMQEAEFMRKGPSPMAREALAILQSSSKTFLGSLMMLSFLVKYLKEYVSASAWQSTVARAAPLIPRPRTKMKIGSSIVLEMTVKRVSPIASFGFPADLIKAFKPK